MKLSKRPNKLLNASKSIALLILILISNGCKTPSAQIVIHDSFCKGKYEPISLFKQDFKNLSQMRKAYPETSEKVIKYITLNEKEFKACPKN